MSAGTRSENAEHGLVRTIGRWSLVALMVNSILGASVFGLPAALAVRLGGWSLVACVIAGAIILVVAACIAEVSSRFDETGGLYLYAREAFGRFTGLLIAWMTWLTRIAAPAAAANLFVTYAAQFFPALGKRYPGLMVLAILIGQLALLNYLGVTLGKHVNNVFASVKVSVLLLFTVAGGLILLTHPEMRVPLAFAAASEKNWFEAILLLMYAYGGFEGALFVGGESKSPKRDTPVALIIALVLICGIYTGIQWVVNVTLPNAGSSERPLADAAMRLLGPWGATAIGLAALVSTYGYLSANLLHAPRVTFALGARGDFPKFLAKVHPKYRTPHLSILVYAALLFTFSALGTFQWNAMLSAVSRLMIYGSMAIALVVLRRRGKPEASFLIPVPYLFSTLGLGFAVLLLMRAGKGEALVVGATALVAFVNWIAVKARE